MERAPVLRSLLVLGAFSVMLVGTGPQKKAEAPAKEAPADAPTAAPAPAPAPTVTIPSSDGWTRSEQPKAKLSVALPPGATVDTEGTGFDPDWSGRTLYITMPSGAKLHFCDKCSVPPISIPETKKFYEENAIGFAGYDYSADDAVIARRTDNDVGPYCETTVCATQLAKPICGDVTALIDENQKVTKPTQEECLAAVAIARSLADTH